MVASFYVKHIVVHPLNSIICLMNLGIMLLSYTDMTKMSVISNFSEPKVVYQYIYLIAEYD